MQIRPIYLVTDSRVLVLARQEPAVVYLPWEIRYASIKRRGKSGDVLFPTQSVGVGNLWSIAELKPLEAALSALLSVPGNSS